MNEGQIYGATEPKQQKHQGADYINPLHDSTPPSATAAWFIHRNYRHQAPINRLKGWYVDRGAELQATLVRLSLFSPEAMQNVS